MKGLLARLWKRSLSSGTVVDHPDDIVDEILVDDRPVAQSGPDGTPENVGTVAPQSAHTDGHPDLQVYELPRPEEVGEPPVPTFITTSAPLVHKPRQLSIDFGEDLFTGLEPSPSQTALSSKILPDDEEDLGAEGDDELLDADFDDDIGNPYSFLGSDSHSQDELQATFDEEVEKNFRVDTDGLLDAAFDNGAAAWESDIDLPLGSDNWLPDSDEIEDEPTNLERRLDEYASKVVVRAPHLKLSDRPELSRRVRMILDEFPFPTTASALGRAIASGTTFDDLEDAFQLKCLWRDSPWLWMQRRYNPMQRSWRIEGNPKLKNNMTWVTAVRLIQNHGYAEAERLITEEVLERWRRLDMGDYAEERAKLWLYDYSVYLGIWEEEERLHDPDAWFYEEPLDVHLRKTMNLSEEGQQIWTFESPDVQWQSVGPYWRI